MLRPVLEKRPSNCVHSLDQTVGASQLVRAGLNSVQQSAPCQRKRLLDIGSAGRQLSKLARPKSVSTHVGYFASHVRCANAYRSVVQAACERPAAKHGPAGSTLVASSRQSSCCNRHQTAFTVQALPSTSSGGWGEDEASKNQAEKQQQRQQQERQQQQVPVEALPGTAEPPLQQHKAATLLDQERSLPNTKNNHLQAQQQQQEVLPQPQQQLAAPRYGQLRQQLKLLQQQAAAQQQQQQQQSPPTYAGLRAAASGSTDLLLSLLNSQMPLLLVPAGDYDSSTCSASAAATPRQRRALLREALVCIAWHCSTHQLLPAEARRLQQMLLLRLLPALAPHVARTNTAVLARVVFALGSCWASIASLEDNSSDQQAVSTIDQDSDSEEEEEGEGEDSAGRQQQQQQQQHDDNKQGQHDEMGEVQEQRVNGQEQQQQQQQERLHQQLAAAAGGHLSSSEWLWLLLPLLPPLHLTPGSLLAAWQGCALHELRPAGQWLAEASMAAYAALAAQRLDYNDTAALLQACAALDYHPPAWLMHSLTWRLQQQLPRLNPADLAGVLSGLHALGFRPGNTWLRVWCECSSRLLRGMNIGQLADVIDALSWTGFSVKPWWGRRFMDASALLLPVATAQELLVLLHGVLDLRLQPPPGWVHEAYCHLRAHKQQLSRSQIADAVHALAALPLPADLVAQHRAWLAGCLRNMQLAGVQQLSRAELLYTLYAAGKLQVTPGKAWLAAALQQLHRQLGAASPAELVGSFVVFCCFRRQPRAEVGLWLRDCLVAVVGCVGEFSDEGLLQLLLTCADVVGLQQQGRAQPQQQVMQDKQDMQQLMQPNVQQQPQVQQRQQQQQQQAMELQANLDQELESYVQVLVGSLVARMPRMSLLQLSRVCKALEAKSSSRRPGWYKQLLRACKAALADRA